VAVASGEMTQAELAERVGVTRQTVIAIEQGGYSPAAGDGLPDRPRFKVPLDEVFHYPDPGPEEET
jgi:putative transcriptional regulator